jgi:hypothetical protein
MQNWLIHFYPEKREIVRQAEELAKTLGGQLKEPPLSWKYSWIRTMFGWDRAKRAQILLRGTRWGFARAWDKTMSRVEARGLASNWGI